MGAEGKDDAKGGAGRIGKLPGRPRERWAEEPQEESGPRFGNIQVECQPAAVRGPVYQAGETRGPSADGLWQDGSSAPVWLGPSERLGQDLGDVLGVGETTTEGEVREQVEYR